jgi:sugar transferase (PEP-CTERM/EpsH1 system associated)
MNVLFLTQVLPYPPDSGGKIKAYNLIRYLAQRHTVALASFIRLDRDEEYLPHLEPYCRRIETVMLDRSRFRDGIALARSLLTGRPFLIERDRSSEMQALVKQLVAEERPDILHVVQLNMAQYALGITDIPRVLDQENAVSTIVKRLYRLEKPGLRKWLAYLEWRRMEKYEGGICQEFNHVLAVSEEDRIILERLTDGRPNVTVVPIGIDCETLHPISREPMAKGILCLGTMFWLPNVDGVLWFAKEVLPLVRREISGGKFYVVGKNPQREIRALQSASGNPAEAVVVTGYVKDPTPYFAKSAVFVVPLRAGGGMRVKILDAWARGIPIVSTSIGCEGIEVRDGENILVADAPQDFARAVVRVIQDRELARALAANGRKWVEQHYDWRQVYRMWDQVYAGLGRS